MSELAIITPELQSDAKEYDRLMWRMCDELWGIIETDPSVYCHGEGDLLLAAVEKVSVDVSTLPPKGKQELLAIANGIKTQYMILKCDDCKNEGEIA